MTSTKNVYEIKYIPTGEFVPVRKGRTFTEEEVVEVEFVKIGTAKNMKEAKAKFGGYPILG